MRISDWSSDVCSSDLPSVFDLEDGMRKLTVPTLIITGDEDWPCLIPNVFMKRTIPSAALWVMPNTGHALNLEEPDMFNRAIADFLAQVESGRWPLRDPRATIESITGITAGPTGRGKWERQIGRAHA